MPPAAILDIDGTLVDTNYQHAIAWFRALRDARRALSRCGGSTGTSAWAGTRSSPRWPVRSSRCATASEVRATESELYREMIDEVAPLPGARELVHELHERGHAVVLVELGEGGGGRALHRAARRRRADRRLHDLRRRRTNQARARSRQGGARERARQRQRQRRAGAPSRVYRRLDLGLRGGPSCRAAARSGLLSGGFGEQELLRRGRRGRARGRR